MNYPRSEKYDTPELMAKIMGPNPLKLEEELLTGHRIPEGSVVCDLGSGQGLTSVFLAREYGFRVYAADLWSDPEGNRRFFREMGLHDSELTPVKADANALPFAPAFFDALVSIDSYHYFGRDPDFLDRKLLPFVRHEAGLPRSSAAGAAAFVDAGGSGDHARCGLLARHGQPEPGCGGHRGE